MEGEQAFSERLAQAVEQRRTNIQTDELPKLKELFRVFHASFQGLHQVLIRKGVVQEDPYKGEHKISGIAPPADDPYLESERDMAIGIRLDTYDSILEFLNNYFEFRIEALGFRELKQLTDLVRFIHWDQLTAHSSHPTTRGVADMVGRARGSQDSFANSIVSDSVEQLARNSKAIADQIKVITTFKREEYKLMLREQLLPEVEDVHALSPDDAASLDRMRRKHKELGLAGPFVPELASEVIAEENGPEAERRREEALDRLRVEDVVQKKTRPKESLHDVLISAVRALSGASRPLETIGENLRTNTEVARSRAEGLGARLRAWVDKLTNRRPAKLTYQIEYTDDQTGTRHSETIVVDDFLAQIAKKTRLYGSFLAKSGGPWTKIQSASEEQLYQFINKELGECHVIHRRAGALDAHLKEEARPEERKRMKGVKIELSSVRNAVAKANQLKHDYSARKEEHEQLRKLGVDV